MCSDKQYTSEPVYRNLHMHLHHWIMKQQNKENHSDIYYHSSPEVVATLTETHRNDFKHMQMIHQVVGHWYMYSKTTNMVDAMVHRYILFN